MEVAEIIITGIMSVVVNVIVGIILTAVLVAFDQQVLVPYIWLILAAGVPLEAMVALGLLKGLR